MKRITLFLVAAVAMVIASCSNKDSEKRIAELESRLMELESRNSATNTTAQQANNVQPQPEVKPEGPLPSFSFTETEHDFGTIKEGDVVEHKFTFTNTGEAPLIIQNAQGSCGCTVPEWTRTPIQPGESGEITAKFDSKGRRNIQNKTVTVTANTWPKQTTLKIRAMVEPTADPVQLDGPVKK